VALPLPADVKALTNHLAHIDDTEPVGNYTADVDDQDPANYDYDNIGNLMKSVKDSITSIDWNAHGKVKQVVKSSGITINYGYDMAGNRVVKQVMNGGVQQSRDFYIVDLHGNTIAVYKDQYDYVDWSEQHLYGLKRLGVWNYGKYNPGLPLTPMYDSIMVGSYQYELTNHLENVLAVISDKKTGSSSNNTTNDYYKAEVLSQSDNYTSGMAMPGRSVNSSRYRYSINGQEKEKELNENITSAEFWMYDSRTQRRWNLDPRPTTGYSPYGTFGGNAVWNKDIKGDTIINSVGAGNPAHARVDSAIADVRRKNPDMYNYLNTLRVARNGNTFTFLSPGDAGYANAQDVTININEGNIDEMTAEEEERLYKQSPNGGTRVFTAASNHLNGQTNYDDLPAFPYTITDFQRDGTRTMTVVVNGVPTEIKSVTGNSDRKQQARQGYINMLQQFANNFGISHNTFNITVDDFLNNTSGVTTSSYDRGLYGKTVAHELGHVMGIIRNMVVSFYYRQIMGLPEKGHERGNPNGAEAEQQERIFERSRN
jgi:hypothetical protein